MVECFVLVAVSDVDELEFEPHPGWRVLDAPASGLCIDDRQPEPGGIARASAQSGGFESVALVEHFDERSAVVEVCFEDDLAFTVNNSIGDELGGQQPHCFELVLAQRRG